MKKIFSLIILSLVFIGKAQAQVVQHVTLKNGSVLNGYIQQSSNGILTFHSENATIFIENANVETSEQSISISRLDSAWIKWGEANDAFDGVGTARSLILNNIVFRGNLSTVDSAVVETEGTSPKKKKAVYNFNYYLRQKRTISHVKVLEKGVNVKYLEMTPNDYSIIWDDIASIQVDKRPKTALSGINCIYNLRSGETYEGQKAGETENTLSLYTTNGMIQTFNIDDVIKYTFYPINSKQDVFEQSELLDVVNLRNGGSVEGIIIEHNYSSDKDTENYILIQQESGAIQSVKISEISGTQRKGNPKYAPQFDILLNEGDVVVNRQEFKFVGVQEVDDIMTLDSLCRTNIIAKAADGQTAITVEYRDNNGGNVVPFQLVKVTKTTVKKKNIYCFSYKDLINAVYQPQKVVTSVNQTTKAEYVVGGQGVFALYDAKKHRAIPIVVRPAK